MRSNLFLLLAGLVVCVSDASAADGLQRVKYNNPGLVVDLGVGLWAWPVPWDGDGDLDLLCGEFLDSFTYFENVGSRTQPKYARGRRLMNGAKPLTMDLEMIAPVAFDWDKDGDFDLIVGDEDGRVAFVENTGRLVDRLPQFEPPL